MIQIVAESIKKQDDDTLLKCVVDLAENTPKFLRPQIEPLLQMCGQAVANEELLRFEGIFNDNSPQFQRIQIVEIMMAIDPDTAPHEAESS